MGTNSSLHVSICALIYLIFSPLLLLGSAKSCRLAQGRCRVFFPPTGAWTCGGRLAFWHILWGYLPALLHQSLSLPLSLSTLSISLSLSIPFCLSLYLSIPLCLSLSLSLSDSIPLSPVHTLRVHFFSLWLLFLGRPAGVESCSKWTNQLRFEQSAFSSSFLQPLLRLLHCFLLHPATYLSSHLFPSRIRVGIPSQQQQHHQGGMCVCVWPMKQTIGISRRTTIFTIMALRYFLCHFNEY
jgi:hypothetical protein